MGVRPPTYQLPTCKGLSPEKVDFKCDGLPPAPLPLHMHRFLSAGIFLSRFSRKMKHNTTSTARYYVFGDAYIRGYVVVQGLATDDAAG